MKIFNKVSHRFYEKRFFELIGEPNLIPHDSQIVNFNFSDILGDTVSEKSETVWMHLNEYGFQNIDLFLGTDLHHFFYRFYPRKDVCSTSHFKDFFHGRLNFTSFYMNIYHIDFTEANVMHVLGYREEQSKPEYVRLVFRF